MCFVNKEKHEIEKRYVDKEKQNYDHRIEDLVTVYEIVENVVGSSVASDKEHIVVINNLVCNK